MVRKYSVISNCGSTNAGGTNNSGRFTATALLAASVSILAVTAKANEVIDGNATLTVVAGFPFDALGELYVGNIGVGTLYINDGRFTNTNAYIGYKEFNRG